jgi:hypothetical protein
MRYTLDPEIDNIIEWRSAQNVVLDILLNEIIWCDESKRKELPYRLVIMADCHMLIDQAGRVACEFTMLTGGVIMVDWIRSWQDYVVMDETGQTLRKERIHVPTF